MAEAELSYEEMRRKRIEENKKRMEELNLKNLYQALKSKSSPGKTRMPRKPVELSVVRRSSRVADIPKPNYKDSIHSSLRCKKQIKTHNWSDGTISLWCAWQPPIEPLERLRRSHNRAHSPRDLFNRVYASDEERAYATERAEHLESTLGFEYPSFVKPMLQSHVTGGFWLVRLIFVLLNLLIFVLLHAKNKKMDDILEPGILSQGLPNQFCKKNLPHRDVMMTLVDEEGEEFAAKYLVEKTSRAVVGEGFQLTII